MTKMMNDHDIYRIDVDGTLTEVRLPEEQKVLWLPQEVKRLGGNAFRNCEGLEGVVLPEDMELPGAKEETPLPGGLSWIVLPRLERPGLVNRLFRGMDMSLGKPVLYCRADREGAREINRHFGIPELNKDGRAGTFPYAEHSWGGGNNEACGCWHFDEKGLPALWSIEETCDSILFFPAGEQEKRVAYHRVRVLEHSATIRNRVVCRVDGEVCEGIRVFRFGDSREQFHRIMALFLESFGFERFEIDVTGSGSAEARHFRADGTPGTSQLTVEPDTGYFVGNIPLMLLGCVYSRSETLKKIRSTWASMKNENG